MEGRNFGKVSDGQEAKLYEIRSKAIRLQVTDFGAALVSLIVKDKNGKDVDVILGYDNAADYEKNGGCFGASIGRYGNRIAEGKFELNGKSYQLEQNERGVTNLHSGSQGFHKRIWEVSDQKDDSITFTMDSPDGDQGFPGHLKHSITYTVTDLGELILDYNSLSDQDTPLNPTNHTYFNLEGHDSGDVLGQKIQLFAQAFTPVTDEKSIPTGEIRPVAGTPFDFRLPEKIGARIDADDEQLHYGNGYDHNYVISEEKGEMQAIARAWAAKSGIMMDVHSDLPGVQFYTGNGVSERTGKGGVTYRPRAGFCLETQYYPNSINEPNFAKPVAKAGEAFHSRTIYQFTTV